MTPTSVGMRCPECAGDRTEIKRPTSFAGSSASTTSATRVLIGINAAVFMLGLLFGGTIFSGGGSFLIDGGLCGNAVGDGGICGGVIATDGGEWWRVVTSGFLHGGLVHLGLNMFVLYILGQFLEPAIGTPRFVAVYLVSLIAGAFGALLISSPGQFTVGASGAIYGVFIATILVARHRGLDHVVAQLGFWLVLNLVFTFGVSGISIGGHLGGIVGGVLGGLLVLGAERGFARRLGLRGELGALAGVGAAFFVGCVVIATAGVYYVF